MDTQEQRIKKSEDIRKRFVLTAPFFTQKPTFYLDMQEMCKGWGEELKDV